MEPVTDATEHLRVLIANERADRLALVAPIVVALGHEVIAREIDVEDVGSVTARERPDVALVGLGESSEHALELIDKIVREAACRIPPAPGFVRTSRADRTGKGILMERHSIDEQSAFQMLRARPRSDNRKLVDLAAAVVDVHLLLPKHPDLPEQS